MFCAECIAPGCSLTSQRARTGRMRHQCSAPWSRTLQELIQEVQQVRGELGLVEHAVPRVVRVREAGANGAVHEYDVAGDVPRMLPLLDHSVVVELVRAILYDIQLAERVSSTWYSALPHCCDTGLQAKER